MQHFFIRLQKLETYPEKLLEFSRLDWVLSMLCVEHNGESSDPNPHYHFTLSTEPLLLPTLRARLNRIFDSAKGNGHLSIKPWDGEIQANAYMFHESPDGAPYINKGYTDEQLDTFRSYNNTVQTIRSQKPTLTNMITRNLLRQYTEEQFVYTLDQALEDIIQFSIDHNRHVPTPIKIAQIYNTARLTVTRAQEPRAYDRMVENMRQEISRFIL